MIKRAGIHLPTLPKICTDPFFITRVFFALGVSYAGSNVGASQFSKGIKYSNQEYTRVGYPFFRVFQGLFVTEEIPITVSRRAPDKEARPTIILGSSTRKFIKNEFKFFQVIPKKFQKFQVVLYQGCSSLLPSLPHMDQTQIRPRLVLYPNGPKMCLHDSEILKEISTIYQVTSGAFLVRIFDHRSPKTARKKQLNNHFLTASSAHVVLNIALLLLLLLFFLASLQSKSCKIASYGKQDQIGLHWIILDHNRSYWIKLDQIGSNWIKFG